MIQELHTVTEAPASVSILPALRAPTAVDEANHRIANSLQMVSALLSLEARRSTDSTAIASFDRMQRRIGAIAGVHRQLYCAEMAGKVDLGVYLSELADDLDMASADSEGAGRVLIEPAAVVVSAEEATSIGIIVSEIVGNACKYAYAPGAPGTVRIILRALPFGGYWLEVSDRGSGMRPGAGPQGTGLGTQLIAMMAARLRAAHAWHDNAPGTRFTLCTGI